MLEKAGFRNTNSQMAASFSPNGRHIISASEDSQVYVWKHETSSGKSRGVLTTQSHEHFPCKDVSVAVAWPCTIRGDPPPMPVHHSKKNSKRSMASADETPANSKRMLPPLPKKGNNHALESACASPDRDPAAISRSESGNGDSFANSKRMLLPPLPKKSNNHQGTESDSNHVEEDFEEISRTDNGLGDSFSSGSGSIRYGDSPSISAAATPSWSSSYSSFDSSHTMANHSSAWGLVIVTAGFGGEIRCYQNFGLPRRMSRQANLFGNPT